MFTANFHTFGCRLNQAETALIANSFREKGYQIVDFGEPADVCVINSCTVTEQADAKCRQLVRRVLRNNPETFVAVVGCYAQMGAKKLAEIEGLDLVVGTNDKLHLVEYIDEPLKKNKAEIICSKMERKPFTIPSYGTKIPTTRANLKIQEGCNFMCSFCIIPFARGRARSRAFWDIQREAMALVEAGFKEIVLTGVNIGTYDFEGKNFLHVVEMLLSIPGLERLRISSIEPTTIPEEILDIMAENDKLCSHLHIPIQSGSDKILEGMKRNYSIREYLDFIELAADKVPDVLLATDLIVGFPGETDELFQETLSFFNDSPLHYAHVFTFSQRRGTAAVRLEGKVENHIKKERNHQIQQLSDQKKNDFYKKFIGRELRVLTEEQEQDNNGNWLGFSDNYIRVAISNPNMKENELVRVEIQSVNDGLASGLSTTSWKENCAVKI